MVENVPAMKTFPPFAIRTDSGPPAFGFHGVASPAEESTAAALLRGWPPMFRKSPPQNTRFPRIEIVRTGASGPGSQGVASPSDTLSTATFERAAPPTVVKSPPT